MLPSSVAAISGSYVVKCGRTGSPEMRILSFTNDYFLEWNGKRGKKGSVDLRLLSDIRIGQQTTLFQKLPADDLVDVSFSLILPDRTLDLVVASLVERQQWIDAILDVSKMVLPQSSHSEIVDSLKLQVQETPVQTKWKPPQLRAKFVELTNPVVRDRLLKLKSAANVVISSQRLRAVSVVEDGSNEHAAQNTETQFADEAQNQVIDEIVTSDGLQMLSACSTRLSAHLENNSKEKFQADILMSFDTLLGDCLVTDLPAELHAPLSQFLHFLTQAVVSAPQNSDAILYSGVLQKLFSVIDLDVPDTLRCEVLWLLGSLAFWSESCQVALAKQRFSSIMKFLDPSCESPVCSEAIRLVGLVARSHSDFQTHCRDSGALRLLLDLCVCSHARLRSVAVVAVNRVCSGNLDNLQLLQKSGVLDHLMAA
jgi:hypothetical protein